MNIDKWEEKKKEEGKHEQREEELKARSEESQKH